MSGSVIRLIIYSKVSDETERSKLTDLHLTVMEQVIRLGITEDTKVTLECMKSESEDSRERLSADGQVATQIEALSERQLQIAAMLCNHYSIKRIAEELYVSQNTVKKHIQNMKKAVNIEKSGADFIFVLKQMIQNGGK